MVDVALDDAYTADKGGNGCDDDETSRHFVCVGVVSSSDDIAVVVEDRGLVLVHAKALKTAMACRPETAMVR